MNIKAISELQDCIQGYIQTIDNQTISTYIVSYDSLSNNYVNSYHKDDHPMYIDLSFWKENRYQSVKFNFSHFLKYLMDQFLALNIGDKYLTKAEADNLYLRRRLTEAEAADSNDYSEYFTVKDHKLIVKNGAEFTGIGQNTQYLFDQNANVVFSNQITCEGGITTGSSQPSSYLYKLSVNNLTSVNSNISAGNNLNFGSGKVTVADLQSNNSIQTNKLTATGVLTCDNNAATFGAQIVNSHGFKVNDDNKFENTGLTADNISCRQIGTQTLTCNGVATFKEQINDDGGFTVGNYINITKDGGKFNGLTCTAPCAELTARAAYWS